MIRRVVAPALRILLFLLILSAPLVLAIVAQAQTPPPGEGRSLVALRATALADQPSGRGPSTRIPASAPATRIDRQGERVLVQVSLPSGSRQGWADASAFLVLDDPAFSPDSLLERARLVSAQGDRPVLAAALASEVVRRDPSRVEGWNLLGAAGERIASTATLDAGGRPPLPLALAGAWGLKFTRSTDGARFRYDGEAYRRLVALSPGADVAETARLRILRNCGALVDPKAVVDPAAAEAREKDLTEFLASFPESKERLSVLVERMRLVSALAELKARRGDEEGAAASRDAAIESASEISSTATTASRRREADRTVARLTRSFPKKLASEKPVVASSGARARFTRRDGQTFLEVTSVDGKPLIQPHAVTRPDPATLAFDPAGRRLVWDDAPEPGRRRTRILDLARARLFEPAASGEPELLTSPDADGAKGEGDRYTSFVAFSPDGSFLLVVAEGFTADGVRVPRRHLLCDADGKGRPVVVERPFSGPGKVDWPRVSALAERRDV